MQERVVGPQARKKRPRRAAYALPTLFTSANIFFGFISILQAIEGALHARAGTGAASDYFSNSAKALGVAVFSDGLDGFVARLTNTASDFGRELDSLADVITFGIAPAVLTYVWGALFVQTEDTLLYSHLTRAAYLVAFFYLLCGAVRLARFNIQTHPASKDTARSDRRFFVGMPIPAGAAMIATVVYMDPWPVRSSAYSIAWLVLAVIVGLLMVSTWRYPSFKHIRAPKPHSSLVVIVVAGALCLIFFYSQPVLLALASTYTASGIVIRVVGFLRKRTRARRLAATSETHLG